MGANSSTPSFSVSSPGSALVVPNDLPLRRKILSLRYMGYEVEDIAAILETTSATVRAQLTLAIAASASEDRIKMVREAELVKLEELEGAFMDVAVNDVSDRAAKVVLDCMDRRAKILGTDKVVPQQPGNVTLIQILSQMPQINDGVVIDG